MRTLCLLLLLVAACNSKPSTPGGSPSGAPPPTQGAPPDPNCGMSTSDWCPAPPGDPCGEHKDAASCKADPRCVGMPYRGESVVACQYDARGFGTNCPTVGCKSPAK
jgi:hypothetical protein